MAKETSKKATAAEVENEVKNPETANVEAGTSPTNETNETSDTAGQTPSEGTRDQQECKSIAQLQQEATAALNTLWEAMRREGYKVYTGLIFMGTAFEIEKNEEREHLRYKPADLSNVEKLGASRAEAEAAPFKTQPANEKPTTRNIMTNGGRTRSVHVGANNHHEAVKQ